MAEDSDAFAQTTSSMCMEMRAITEALEWLRDSGHAHVIFVTDSMSTLDLVRQGMHYADWKPLITASQLESITWIFSPGHAGVLGNERADVLAGAAVIKGDLIMDPCCPCCGTGDAVCHQSRGRLLHPRSPEREKCCSR